MSSARATVRPSRREMAMYMQKPTKKLSNMRCLCRACDTYFNGQGAFDKHRIGRHGIDRHCMTHEEMSQNGMGPNDAGFWQAEAP